MSKFSPIKSMRVKNFRNIGDVTIDFAESPIVTLIGDNESGKTSIVKALAVNALHAYSRDQKEFIRDGASGFGITVELEDGHRINRVKTTSLNSYSVEYPDGEVWETNKIDAGLPVQVSDLMGLVEENETKQYLQIRTYEDQLLFVVTPASTNYKVMYDALKVEQITKAIKQGNEEVNKLKSNIADTEISVKALSDKLKELKIVDMEALLRVRDKIGEELGVLEKLERVKALVDEVQECENLLGNLKLIEENGLEEIDVNLVSMLNNTNSIVETLKVSNVLLEKYKDLEALENIDVAPIKKMEDLIENMREHSRLAKLVENLSKLEGLEEVRSESLRLLEKAAMDVKDLEMLEKRVSVLTPIIKLPEIPDRAIQINGVLENIKKEYDMLPAYDTEIEKSLNYVKQVEDYMKRVGAHVITCNNCGEDMVMTEDGTMAHSH